MFQKGKDREETSEFLVDVFPWPSPDRLLQLSAAQHLFVCSTPPGHPEGLPGILLLLSTPEWSGVTGNPLERRDGWPSLAAGAHGAGQALLLPSFPAPREEPTCR